MLVSSLHDQTPFLCSVWRGIGLNTNIKMELGCEVQTDIETPNRFQSSYRDVSKEILHRDGEGKGLFCLLWVPVAQY